MPNISDEAARQGGRLVLDVIPELAGNVHAPANASDKLVWDNATSQPCGPHGATAAPAAAVKLGSDGRTSIGWATCPARTGPCTVSAAVAQVGRPSRSGAAQAAARHRLLGRVKLHLRAGRTVQVTVRLKRRIVRSLPRRGSVPVRITLRVKPKHAHAATAFQEATLTR